MLIAVKKSLAAELVTSVYNNIEHIFVKICCGHETLIVGCVYIQPNAGIEIYDDHCSEIRGMINKYPGCKFLLFGDYNLPLVEWVNDIEVDGVSDDSDTNKILNEFAIMGLIQLNRTKNRLGRCLDWCLSNMDCEIVRSYCLVTEDNYHPTVGGEFHTYQGLGCNNSVYFNFTKVDYGGFNNYLLKVNWINIYHLSDIDDILAFFYDILRHGVDLFVPLCRSHRNYNYPLWFNKALIDKIRCKCKFHSLYKRTGIYNYYCMFAKLREECKDLCKKCFTSFNCKMESKISNDQSFFWNYYRKRSGSSQGFPSSMRWGNRHAEGGVEVADLFASFFGDIYTSGQGGIVNLLDIHISNTLEVLSLSHEDLEIVYDDLLSGLLCLDVKKGPGPDGIPNRMLRECAVGLCEPLCFIFNFSLAKGVFPMEWKKAYIVPVFKAGSRAVVGNYRPVCIQSALPKLLEKMILKKLLFAFRNVIIQQQHGFMRGRSTISNMVVYLQDVISHLNDGLDVHAIYTDFSKAFDLVNHEILIHKLRLYGFNDILLKWFVSYLSGRSLSVKVDGTLSHAFSPLTGVPQGSHLGPLLYNIYVNDIGKDFKSNYLLFADDLKIYRGIKDAQDIIRIQFDLDRLSKWCIDNRLIVNVKKCATMVFSRHNNPWRHEYIINGVELGLEDSVRDLGIIIDSKLSFNPHINSMISKANRVLGGVFRYCSEFKNAKSLVQIFSATVRPIVEYGSIIWYPLYAYQVNNVESVQCRFIKRMKYLFWRDADVNVDDVRALLGLFTLEKRRMLHDIVFGVKIINGWMDVPEILGQLYFTVPKLSLREPRLLSVPRVKSNQAMHAPLYHIIRNLNNCNVEVNFFERNIDIVKPRVLRSLM